ncbi:YhgE/Pip family protein [Actinoplanes sp. RD1]|uniref:YhgE/Pip family protein n=1 Tax=Actinoplanes sp. RD1 TaxID=3064538 RepID=UPI002740BE9F|nr:YhgE/Pip domain-containing protein [Actinoplanes sp. RD1]
MTSIRLAGFELRRFLRGRLPAAALAVLCVVPLLYGALYLYAFWDPYGRLNHIPAALVVEDKAATATDGTRVHAGQDLADELIEREVFDWHVTDERGAEAGLADGSYQLSLRIPSDFSANLTTGPDEHAQPKAAELLVVNDDATNYLSGIFSKTAFAEVRAAAAQSAQSGYFDKMLIGFTDAQSQTQEAADGAHKIDNGLTDAESGADQLNDGLGDAQTGAGRLADGLGDAETGAGQLSSGLGTAAQGADDLADGLAALQAGTAQLVTGTRQAATGGRQLATAVDQAADRIEPVLRDNAQAIQDAAREVAQGADLLARNVGRLDDAADDAVRTATRLQDYLAGLPDDTPGIDQAREDAAQLVAAARRVRTAIDDSDLTALSKRLTAVAADARKVAAAAPHLADDVAAARSQVDELASGLGQLATGAQQVNDGAQDAAAGADDLRGGLFRLASGARELDSGLDTLAAGGNQLAGGLGSLSAGGAQLASGLGDLQTGAAKLASGLSDGADQLPSYGDDPSQRADLLGNPVQLDRTVRHPAATYGVGFAPYFLSLALWVGAMITFMVLRPFNRRYLVSGTPAYRVALAGLLPAVAVGLVQALLLFAVVVFGLGLNPVSPVLTLGLLMLTATAFAAIMQLLGAAAGPAGRIVALALLMLQLTSSGGTYPVETSPGFFQAIHPLLPMTYTVGALRHTIDGGPAGTVVSGLVALLAYGLGALALTIVVAHRKRRLTPSALHPELVI